MFSCLQRYPIKCDLRVLDPFRSTYDRQVLSDIPEKQILALQFFVGGGGSELGIMILYNSPFSIPLHLGNHIPKRGQSDTGENILFQ
jgi:hypothetical protein